MKDKEYLMFFEIINHARDAHMTKGAQQSLLYHLILRCDPKKDYSCFPGYDLLCADTGLDMTTVKRAARELEKKDLVKRIVRPNHSNLWYVNVKLLQEVANRNCSTRADDNAAKPSCPFDPPTIRAHSNTVPSAQPTVTTSKAGSGDASAADMDIPPQPTPEEQIVVRQIRDLLKDRLGDHSTFQDPNAKNILGSCIDECIAHAGSAKRCKGILKSVLKSEDKLNYLRNARLLGGCLRKCFPGWVADFDQEQMADCQEDLLNVCHGIELQTVLTGNIYSDTFPLYLRNTLGHHLLHLGTEQVGERTRFIVEITDAAKLTHILAAHAGQAVDVASVPEFVDATKLTLLKWATANEPWATALRECKEPLAYFLDRCYQIEEDADDRNRLEMGRDEDEQHIKEKH